MERLVDPAYKAHGRSGRSPSRIEAWDINCRQHIVPRYTEAEIAPAVDQLAQRIKELEEEVARLKGPVTNRHGLLLRCAGVERHGPLGTVLASPVTMNI